MTQRMIISRQSVFDIDGVPVQPFFCAPLGEPGLYCAAGVPGHYVTLEQFALNGGCRLGSADYSTFPDLLWRDLSRFQGEVWGDWWHFSYRPDWPTGQELVHLGSLPAALMRIDNRSREFTTWDDAPSTNEVTQMWFYKVRVKPGVQLTQAIIVESVHGQMTEDVDRRWHQPAHVLRYVNRQEEPGSVSLMLAAIDCEVVDRIRIPFYRIDASVFEALG